MKFLLNILEDIFTSKQESSNQRRVQRGSQEVKRGKIPKHIAIIMDGNGRWAQQQGLPRSAGHKAGVDNLKRIIDCALEIGVDCMTLYAFSTENWKRPKKEVNYIMGLIDKVFKTELDNFLQKGVKVVAIGCQDRLPDYVRDRVNKTMEATADNDRIKVNIALDYGGRTEIVAAVKKVVHQVSNDIISIKEIDEKMIANNLYTSNDPEIDLLIRPGGEKRISNFLLWQLAYTELYFSNTYWPAFKETEFLQAIAEFQNRERRFGTLKKARDDDA